MAAYLPLEVQRNGVYACLLTFTDNEDQPLDLTGATFDLGVKYAAGDSGGRVYSANLTVTDPLLGMVELVIDGRAFDSVPGRMDIVELAYDLIATQAGAPLPMLRGPLILIPGVS